MGGIVRPWGETQNVYIDSMRERLELIPHEHWQGDKLKGVSIYIRKILGSFVGYVLLNLWF